MQEYSYAFSAYWLADASLNTGDVVVFSKKLLDEGELYDTSTGKYSVPVSGVYYFVSTLCSNANYGAVKFVADGVRIGAFDFGDSSYHICSSGSAVVKLVKNAKVWLAVTDSVRIYNGDNAGGFNNFAGYLINEQ